jgi:hypothetical protein
VTRKILSTLIVSVVNRDTPIIVQSPWSNVLYAEERAIDEELVNI